MLLVDAQKNPIKIYDVDEVFEINIPENISVYDMFSTNKNNRYIALAPQKTIYVYDRETKQLITAPFKLKPAFHSLRFDENDQLYFISGNAVSRWKIESEKEEELFVMKRATHGPSDLGVSPSGKYVSFLKYRSDSNYLYILDTTTGECVDTKISVYHYAWTDETHIAFTKSGGLKILEVTTGKSKTVVKDHTALAKKCPKDNAAILERYVANKDHFITYDLDLLDIYENKIWFSFYITDHDEDIMARDPETNELTKNHICHHAVWNVNLDGTSPRLCYEVPADYWSAILKAGAGWKYFVNGCYLWNKDNSLHVFDGKDHYSTEGELRPVVLYKNRCR